MASTKRPKKRTNTRSKRSSRMRWKSRILDGGIFLTTIALGAFIFSVAGRLSHSHAERNDRPPRVLRTQVLNGCGESGLAATFGEQLSQIAVKEFRFDVIDADNFHHFDVDESFIMVYTLSLEEAMRLATAFGMSEKDVRMMGDTENPWGLDISIVLGRTARPVLSTSPISDGESEG